MIVRVVPVASGATRLHVSPFGKFTAAEIRGAWITAEWNDYEDHIPGVVKILDKDEKLVASVQGWPLGPPDDTGALLYVEEAPVEYRYRLRSTAQPARVVALEPPDGYWHVKATLDGGPERVVVILWSPLDGHDWQRPATRRERLWLASINRGTLAVEATRVVDATTPARNGYLRYAYGVAAAHGLVGYLELPDPDAEPPVWHVVVVDSSTLAQLWRVALPGSGATAPPASLPSPSRGKKIAPAPVLVASPTTRAEREMMTAELAFSDDGGRLLVVHGRDDTISISADAYHVLAAADGKVVRTLAGAALPPFPSYQLASVPGTPMVSVLHLSQLRSGPDKGISFFGFSQVDLEAGEVTTPITRSTLERQWKNGQYLVPRAGYMLAQAVVLAPPDFEWVVHSGIGGNWPSGEGRGARAPEVAQWVTMPLDWHRRDRASVAAHDQWMEDSRR